MVHAQFSSHLYLACLRGLCWGLYCFSSVMYVPDLPLTANSKVVLYADAYILLYRPVCSTANFACLREATTSSLRANSLNLHFNAGVWKAMVLDLSKRKFFVTPILLFLNGQPIVFVDSIKCLRLTIVANLS